MPLRRGENGFEFGPTWESIVERKIRESVEPGQFDELPGLGRPLAIEEHPFAGDWELGFHVMRNADVLPTWVELSREVQRLLDRRDELLAGTARWRHRQGEGAARRAREEYRQLVLDINAAVERFNLHVPFVWLQKVPLPLRAELEKFDRLAGFAC